IEKAKKKKWLEHELRPSIQKKLIGYMGQDKEKGREFDLTVDYILMLKHIQEDKCELCLIEMKVEWDRPGDISQWTVDRIHNNLGHIKGNVRLTLEVCSESDQSGYPVIHPKFDRIRIDPVDDQMDHQISGQSDICNSGRTHNSGRHYEFCVTFV